MTPLVAEGAIIVREKPKRPRTTIRRADGAVRRDQSRKRAEPIGC